MWEFLQGLPVWYRFLKKKNPNQQNKPKPEASAEAQLKQLKITVTIFFLNVHKINLQSPSPKSSLACGFHRRFALYLISQRLTNAAHLSSPRTAAILIIYSKELLKKKKISGRIINIRLSPVPIKPGQDLRWVFHHAPSFTL